MTTHTLNASEIATEPALVITRVFDAPRNIVFRAFTEPERMKQWFSPKGFTTPYCCIDPRPGGASRICMRGPDGKEYWSTGVYQEVVVPERIVCTDSFSDAEGNVISPTDYGMGSDWPTVALQTLIFTEEDGKTRLTLRHSPLQPGHDRDMCEQGWNETLDHLEEYLAR